MTRSFAVSVHDVAPVTWARCRELLALLPAGVPATLLVVPCYRRGTASDDDPAFVAALRARIAAGDDVALHGYFHVDEARAPRTPRDWLRRRVCTAGEGEFAAIDAPTATLRLADGLARLRRAGLAPRGFVAPAWLVGAAAAGAVAALDVGYTCTRDELVALPHGERLRAPSLVCSSRSAWRRALSLIWNAARLLRLRREPLVRVALHPADAEHPEVMARWRALLGRLAAERRPVLEADWLARHTPPRALSAGAASGV